MLVPNYSIKLKFGRNDNMDTSDKKYLVQGVEEAIRAGYRQGFEDGWAAARLTVELVVNAWRKDPTGFDVESALKALDISREKAREMLARDKFNAVFVPLAEPEQKWFG